MYKLKALEMAVSEKILNQKFCQRYSTIVNFFAELANLLQKTKKKMAKQTDRRLMTEESTNKNFGKNA